MSRLAVLTLEGASDDQRELLEQLPDMKLFRTLAHAPAVTRGFVAYGVSLLYESNLNPVWRELVILAIAHERTNRYEINEHERIADEVGCSQEKIQAMRPDSSLSIADVLCQEEQELIEFALETVRNGAPSDECYARVSCFLSAQELVELAACVAFYWGAAMFIDTFGLEPEVEGHDDNVKIGAVP